MKKFLTVVLVVAVIMTTFATVSFAQDPIKVYVTGNQVNFDSQPQIVNGRTMVPMRAIFEALGSTVEWEDATKTITAKSGAKMITLKIGSDKMNVTGNEITLDAAPFISGGRTLVPVRAISEALDCAVSWNDKERTVQVEKKFKSTGSLIYDGDPCGSPRILITGNSITHHGASEKIGWTGSYGMAASSKENDFVHILIKRVREIHPNATFLVVQAASWERAFTDENVLNNYRAAQDFRPDIFIYRLGENVAKENRENLADYIEKYVKFLTAKSDDPAYIFTTNYWKNEEVDNATRAVAQRFNTVAKEIGHLEDDKSTMALGLFENSAVASHPGDKGMLGIADAIWEDLELLIK